MIRCCFVEPFEIRLRHSMKTIWFNYQWKKPAFTDKLLRTICETETKNLNLGPQQWWLSDSDMAIHTVGYVRCERGST